MHSVSPRPSQNVTKCTSRHDPSYASLFSLFHCNVHAEVAHSLFHVRDQGFRDWRVHNIYWIICIFVQSHKQQGQHGCKALLMCKYQAIADDKSFMRINLMVKPTGPKSALPSTCAVASVSLRIFGFPLQTVVPSLISVTYISGNTQKI